MKYLKKYSKVFEWKSEPIPDNFIDLQSIGHVMDPDTGRVYAKLTRGGYDIENPYWVEDEMGNLSDDDVKIVDEYITYSKDVIDVDDKLINNIKDFLLDLIDNHYKVSIGIECNTIHVLTKLFGRKRDWSYQGERAGRKDCYSSQCKYRYPGFPLPGEHESLPERTAHHSG